MSTNKKIFLSLIILLALVMPVIIVEAEAIGDNFCSEAGVKNALRFIGWLILIARIVAPFTIILMGTFDVFKAVTSDKNEDLKKQLGIFGKRIFAGMIIFFVPLLVNMAMVLISGAANENADWHTCRTCILEPNRC